MQCNACGPHGLAHAELVHIHEIVAWRFGDENPVVVFWTRYENSRAARVAIANHYRALHAHQFSQVRHTLRLSGSDVLGRRRRLVIDYGDLFRLDHRHSVLHRDDALGLQFVSRTVIVE